jgi:Macrocin-O-methyltransferase (TylF)
MLLSILSLIAIGVLIGVLGVRFAWPRLRRMLHLRLAEVIAEVAEKREHDVSVALVRQATAESAAFVSERMNGSGRSYPNKFALLEAGLALVDPKDSGLYCEFGVYRGTTLNFIAQRTKSVVHGFDSFEGLPTDWRSGFEKGRFKVDEYPKVLPNVELHAGWFSETLPPFKDAHAGPLLFAHLDADLYDSTKVVFDVLGDRIVKGTVLHFDEYFNHPGWRNGEHKAFEEFRENRKIKFEFIGYVPGDEQVSLRVIQIDPL